MAISRRQLILEAMAAGAGLAAGGVAVAQTAAADSTEPGDQPDSEESMIRSGSERIEPNAHPELPAYIHLNQVGFLPRESKRALVPCTGPVESRVFVILDDDAIPTERYRGALIETGPGSEPAEAPFSRLF